MGKYQAYPEYKDSGVDSLGPVPSHWEVMQLKRSVNGCVNGIWGSEPNNDGFDTIVIRVADFNRQKLAVNDDGFTFRKIEEKEKFGRLLKKGDLLLEKSGGGEKTLVGQVVLFDKDFEAVTSNFVAKMTPAYGFDGRYLNYVFCRFYSHNLNYGSIKQNTGIQNLDSASYLTEKFGFPNLDEQLSIANFLDHETAKIDTLIEQQQQLIQLLKEKRQAVISHAVTKGLSSFKGGPKAPMKDSGVEWLGEVPAHWDVSRLKFVAKIESGHTPDKKNESYWIDCDIPWVSLNDSTQLKQVDYISETSIYLNEKGIANSSARKLPPRTVVFTRDASIGLAAITTKVMAVSQHVIAWVCLEEKVIPEFLLLIFYAMSEEFNRYTFGATLKTIGMADINKLTGAFPPIEEQKKIIEHVFKMRETLNVLISKAEHSILLMQERRTALISAAVTGKIDVRTWQAPQQ